MRGICILYIYIIMYTYLKIALRNISKPVFLLQEVLLGVIDAEHIQRAKVKWVETGI